ncbi:MAG: acyl-CoA dehydrogenase C-terminal domain-containing protein [Burkholderiales bacterium]|nr:acyl-CoA dehydrogenase C-terminal domain-containing protein [Burkholderiales bacterium]
MYRYCPPLRDQAFVLHELLGTADVLAALPCGADWDRATIDQTLAEAARFMAAELLPLNTIGDREGCSVVRDADGAPAGVRLPAGFAAAWQRYVAAGWPALGSDQALGGQGAPSVVAMAVYEYVNGCNPAWGMIPGAMRGAYRLLRAYGSPQQQRDYLTRIVSGEWTATMAITEPQCGSDLSLLRTRAEPRPDGSFAIHGSKLFITGGDHDMAANIVHLVLARLPDAPPGVGGISLFLVPRHLPDAGAPGGLAPAVNAMVATAVEHKMGLNGSPTCAMSFDGSIGWLVGQPHQGLRAMFVMINSARVAIGAQATGMGQAAHDSALAYARERLQMRVAGGPARPDLAADPIVLHADVRRMLLTQKAHVEAARMFTAWLALTLDIAETHPDAARRESADRTVALLTPVLKAFTAENATLVANLAIQVHGGHGYVRDHGVEQIVRDVRVAQIYDGTTAVQARDLLSRRVLADQGRGLKSFLSQVREDARPMEAFFREPLLALCDGLESLTADIAAAQDDMAGASGCDYLRALGHLVCGWLFARAARVAGHCLAEGRGDGFHRAKQATARFYVERLLPQAQAHIAVARSGVASLSALDERELFGESA